MFSPPVKAKKPGNPLRRLEKTLLNRAAGKKGKKRLFLPAEVLLEQDFDAAGIQHGAPEVEILHVKSHQRPPAPRKAAGDRES